MSAGSRWMGRILAADLPDLAYVRGWASAPRSVIAEIAGELAFFGPQAPDRRSVLGFTAAMGTRLSPVGASTWMAPDVQLRQLLLSAAARGELWEEGGIPSSYSPEVARAVAEVVAGRQWALIPSGRHDFRGVARRDPRVPCVVPVSPRLGRISEFGSGYRMCFNSGYFIWLDEEFADGFASSGDPIGLEIADGVITSPPIVSRSALLRVLDPTGAERLQVTQVDVGDITIALPGGLIVHGETARCRCSRSTACVSADESKVRILTRGRGADAVVSVPTGYLGLTIYGRRVVQVDRENAPCPSNGLVLLLPEAAAGRLIEQVQASAWVVYDLDLEGSRAVSGSQVGPAMIRGFEPVDIVRDVVDGREVYHPAEDYGADALPPVALTAEKIVDDRRARAAVGLTPAGDVCVLVAEGCEPRSMEPGYDVVGATMAEMTTVLADAGCSEAVALDSGGAASISRCGRLVLPPADRNDVVGVPFERFVPAAWRLATSSEPEWSDMR